MKTIATAIKAKHIDECRSERPSWPETIYLELTNICNQDCIFCSLKQSDRPKRHMDVELAKRLLEEARHKGTHRLGLTMGAEPLMSPHLEEVISFAHNIGYDYIYMTTNGVTNNVRWQNIIDTGIDSIKISINAGDRDTYKLIHGRDDWESACESVLWLSRHFKGYLSVGMVVVTENAHTMKAFKSTFEPLVKEAIFVPADNQSGLMPKYAPPTYTGICNLPFDRIHVSVEGFYRLCCGDNINATVVSDLNKVSLKDAFYSDKAIQIRRQHIRRELEDTFCGKCLQGGRP